MKILHTGDIHLKAHGDDRWKTLERLIDLGRERRVEIFVVSGDLFDRDVDAENLRPRIRELFSNTGFKIVLIPGNHDRDSYRRDMWFGEDAVILTDFTVPFEFQSVRIWGMPFEPIEGEKILHNLYSLQNRLTTDMIDILLYHGELLDAFFSREDFGDEGEGRYMPVKLSYFSELKFDYVLAGHFHSNMDVWKLENGGYFVYSGSPVSITKRETGQRKVNIFEPGTSPREVPVDTPHFEEIIVEFDPFRDHQPLKTVERRFDSLHPEARALLTLKGFLDSKIVGMSEKKLVEEVKGIVSGKCAVEHYEFKDIHVILEDDLTKRFMERLEEIGYEEEVKRQVRDSALKAMMETRR